MKAASPAAGAKAHALAANHDEIVALTEQECDAC
jgi:hypothetical protein